MLSPIMDRRGIALPLALLALVIVSFLVVSAIVTSGAELTGSSTHQRATASLYRSEAALEQYIATKAARGAAQTDSLSPTTAAGDPLITGFLMHVGRLSSDVDTVSRTLYQKQLYSVLTTPAGARGRTVGAFVRTERQAEVFFLNVQAGLTVGGDATVAGNAVISDGSDNLAACDAAPAEHAIQVSAGSTITQKGSSQIVGSADTATFQQTEMVQHLLGGLTIQEAVALATIKMKASEFTQNPRSHDSDVPRLRSNKFNWGCPSGADLICTTVAGNEDNINYFPMVAIDAEGGKVTVSGDHGQGILIIHNGAAEISGNMVYHGIIIVEGDMMVRGTVRIQGAVVSLGATSTLEDDLTGTSTVTFNRCINERAQESANEQRLLNAAQTFPSPTSNWFERIQ
jgi:hypothetical protein